jgi:hypothetical protein
MPLLKRLTLLLYGLIAGTVANSSTGPSDRLMNAVFADYFTRYICVSKFPATRMEIQSAYDASAFRFIRIHCRGLKCDNPDQERGLEILLERSRRFSDAENRKICGSYRKGLREAEGAFDEELRKLFPESATGK